MVEFCEVRVKIWTKKIQLNLWWSRKSYDLYFCLHWHLGNCLLFFYRGSHTNTRIHIISIRIRIIKTPLINFHDLLKIVTGEIKFNGVLIFLIPISRLRFFIWKLFIYVFIILFHTIYYCLSAFVWLPPSVTKKNKTIDRDVNVNKNTNRRIWCDDHKLSWIFWFRS